MVPYHFQSEILQMLLLLNHLEIKYSYSKEPSLFSIPWKYMEIGLTFNIHKGNYL